MRTCVMCGGVVAEVGMQLIEKGLLFLLMVPVVVIVYALSYLCLPLMWALTMMERRRVW